MKLSELKAALARHPDAPLRFVLPNRETVPAQVHGTEVGRIDKRFIDCGGTLRNDRCTCNGDEQIKVFRQVRDEIRPVFEAYAAGRNDPLKAK